MSFSPESERVVGVLLLRRPKSFGRWDTFAAAITEERMIFAQITSEMIKEAVEIARKQAKAEGKGFLGQWSAQLRASFNYAQKYLSMSPEEIIAETQGNFAVSNDSVREIKLKPISEEGTANEFSVEIRYSSGKLAFRMDRNAESVELLKQVYGDRVKLPFGYSLSGLSMR